MAGAQEKGGVQSRRPLHNFLMPTHLKWGRQKQLRFSKPAPSRHRSPIPATDHHRRQGPSSPVPTTKTLPSHKSQIINSEIEIVREKLISGLKVGADQFKLPVMQEKKNKEKKPAEEELKWNLRTRRNVGSSPLKGFAAAAAAAADKGEANGGGSGGNQPPLRPKFSLTLTKEEIEEDFLKMTGAKPPKRPKKRTKNVQKHLNALVPGKYLTEVTPDKYNHKVSETDHTV